ncbi:FCD domain-containing protein [Ancylobacter sp. 6x-1]|uniref:FCD domain-containing protein n=1 Tax=Ancylobacter crimeensis TaxID=2579147 RepID=A0ABT0DDV0_9HYPH|nr:FCD domain-containing protein [Ancylobacter crimeensis]MCK0198146.1 FCD domain-containing protein [Ancylobacter crimeensis]
MREQIAERLAGMIQSGLLKIGDELPSEREIAQMLDVSRETVRGAVQMLAAIGMVEISQGARTRIIGTEGFGRSTLPDAAELSRYGAEDVYRARLLIEVFVVRSATQHIDADTRYRLHRLVEAQAEMTEDPIRFLISDAEFHQLIFRAGRNLLLAHFLDEAYGFALTCRRQALLEPGAVGRSVEDHRLIVSAFDARDPDAAAAAMERHITRVHETTLQVLEA